jgi:hypothetical protein
MVTSLQSDTGKLTTLSLLTATPPIKAVHTTNAHSYLTLLFTTPPTQHLFNQLRIMANTTQVWNQAQKHFTEQMSQVVGLIREAVRTMKIPDENEHSFPERVVRKARRMFIEMADNYIHTPITNAPNKTPSGVLIKDKDPEIQLWTPKTLVRSTAASGSVSDDCEEYNTMIIHGGELIDLVSDDEDLGETAEIRRLNPATGNQRTFQVATNSSYRRARTQQLPMDAMNGSTRAHPPSQQTRDVTLDINKTAETELPIHFLPVRRLGSNSYGASDMVSAGLSQPEIPDDMSVFDKAQMSKKIKHIRDIADQLEQKMNKKGFKNVGHFDNLARKNLERALGTTFHSVGALSLSDNQTSKASAKETLTPLGKRRRVVNNRHGPMTHYHGDSVDLTNDYDEDYAVVSQGRNVVTVIEFTGCTPEQATKYLSLSNGNTTLAVQKFFDEDGEASSTKAELGDHDRGQLFLKNPFADEATQPLRKQDTVPMDVAEEATNRERDDFRIALFTRKDTEDLITWLNTIRNESIGYYNTALLCISEICKHQSSFSSPSPFPEAIVLQGAIEQAVAEGCDIEDTMHWREWEAGVEAESL